LQCGQFYSQLIIETAVSMLQVSMQRIF